MYTQPTPFPVSDPHAASRYCWQGDVYYDSRDYADFPLRNDAADTSLSTAAYQASRVPLSEDGRRCLIGLLSTLAGYQQSRLVQALASSHFLGLPIQVATLAQGLYTAVREGHHRSAFILSSLTLACRYLPGDCHPLLLLAGELRQNQCHWLGDALAESLFGQDLPQSVSASLLGLSCCAAALYHYVQQWLEPTADKVLYFGNQQQIADAEYDYLDEAVKLSHYYFHRVIDIIETITMELIAHRPALRQRVRKYLQCLLENCDSDILDRAESQFIGYCQQALQFLNDTRAVNFTNIIVIATRQRDDHAPSLLGSSKPLSSVYGAQQHSLRGMVFIADALLCHPDRWRQMSKTGLFIRSVEDLLRATLQISSVFNNFIPLTQESLTLLPDQPTANAIMTYRLNTLGQDSDLHAFLTTYAARHNLRLSSNLTEVLTQHQALKADIIMNNIDHITMMVKEMFLQIKPSSP